MEKDLACCIQKLLKLESDIKKMKMRDTTSKEKY